MAKEINIKEAYYACALSILGVYEGRGKKRYYPSIQEATNYFINKEAHWVDGKKDNNSNEILKEKVNQPQMVQQTLF